MASRKAFSLGSIGGLLPIPGPVRAARLRIGLRFGIDDLLVVPGFGAFMRGWMICRQRRTELVSLKLGTQILEVEPGSCAHHARPDLTSLSKRPMNPAIIATAGFTVIFRGAAPKAWYGRALSRIEASTGESFLLPIDTDVIRVCDESGDLQAIADCYPELSQKNFFYEFARSFGKAVRARAAHIRPISIQQVPRALILCLPMQADDMILTFDKVATFSADLPEDVGIAVLYTPFHVQGRVLALMNDLRLRCGRPISLVRYNDPVYALWSLRSTLDSLSCKSFWFVGPNAIATKSGWRFAAQMFTKQSSGIDIFAGERSTEYSASSLSFMWSRPSIDAWEQAAPFFLSGFYRDNGLPQPSSIAKGTIRYLAAPDVPGSLDACDARIYESYKIYRDGLNEQL